MEILLEGRIFSQCWFCLSQHRVRVQTLSYLALSSLCAFMHIYFHCQFHGEHTSAPYLRISAAIQFSAISLVLIWQLLVVTQLSAHKHVVSTALYTKSTDCGFQSVDFFFPLCKTPLFTQNINIYPILQVNSTSVYITLKVSTIAYSQIQFFSYCITLL